MARRFRVIISPFNTSDPEAQAKYRAIWTDAMKDHATASKLALNREIFSFVDQAIAHLKAQAK